MLLVQLTVNTVVKRISDTLLTLEHTWYPYVDAFSAPQWQITKDYGGFGRLGFGTITISPELFESDWPPPIQCNITIQYTASTEAAAVTILADYTAHLTDYNRESVTFKIQDFEYEQKLLIEMDDYNGNTVAIPKAVGTVTHVTPTRLADVDIGAPYGDAPTYHLSGVSASSTAFRIIGFTYHSAGVTKIITGDIDGDLVNHGYGNGETVIIVNSSNFNTSHVISNVSGATFTIPEAYAIENVPIYASVYQTNDIQVFDDGVPIPGNFYDNSDGTFSLMAVPVGQVTISGTASETTVDDLGSWAKTTLGITTYTNTYARSPSPSVNRWETSQQTIVDFLSEVCSTFTHLSYIKDDVLHMVDMYIDNGSTSLKNHEFLESPRYGHFSPVKSLTSTWDTYSAFEGTSEDLHDLSTSHYIKTTPHEIKEELYDYGNEMNIEPYQDDEANVRSCLVLIREMFIKDKVSVEIPISATLPDLGEKISWTDNALPDDIPGYIRARTLSFNFIDGTVLITGEGIFLQPGYMGRMVDGSLSGATTETIDIFDHGLGKGAVWDYIVDDGARTNMRIGRIAAVWDQAAGTTPEIIADSFSDDIGTTLGLVNFSVDKSTTNVRLRCTSVSGSWVISGSRQIIGG